MAAVGRKPQQQDRGVLAEREEEVLVVRGHLHRAQLRGQMELTVSAAAVAVLEDQQAPPIKHLAGATVVLAS